MKKLFIILLCLVTVLSCTGCGEEKATITEPELSEMRAICELGVMDCYYHNVAKFYEENASGVLWWQKDKLFWIEYSGIVRIGIDVDKLKMDVDGNTINITIPPARVLKCTVDESSLNKGSYIVDSNSAKISGADEVMAFDEAQKRMEESASGDRALLSGAQERVKKLLEDYIINVVNNRENPYTINWIYTDADEVAAPQSSAAPPDSETTA